MRWKFFIPIAVIFGGLAAFYAFGMDAVAAKGMEKVLATIFNARAEVTGVDISLIKGRVKIGRISVADADNPMFNLFESGRMVMDTPVKALLMQRLVIEEASIKDVSWGAPRKTSGALKKDKPEGEAAKKPVKKVSAEKEGAAESKPLLAAADVKSVGADYFENQKVMFKSPKLAEGATAKADELKNKWEPKLDEVSVQLKQAEAAAGEIKKIDTSRLETAGEIASALKILRDNSKVIKTAVDSANNVKKEFDADTKAVQKLKNDISAAREADWRLVSAQLNVPVGTQFQSFTQDMLSGILHKKAGSFAQYIEKGVEVMAKMKEQEKKKATPKPKKEKFKGRDVVFKSMLFPKFHLKHAEISVKKEELSLEGELVNFRTSPEKSEKPATFRLEGRQNRGGIKISGVIDNRTPGGEKSKVFFRGIDFPLEGASGSIPYVKLNDFNGIYNVDLDYFAPAGAKAEVNLNIRIRDMKVSGDEKDLVTGLVIDAIRATPELVIEGTITGGAGKFSSNLDNVLSKKVKERISAEIAASQKKARESFDAYIGGYEKTAFASLDAFKDSYESKIKGVSGKAQSYDKVADSYEKQIEDRKKEIRDKEADKVKDKAKGLFKKLR